VYFARVRHKGKWFRVSRETEVFSIANFKLTDNVIKLMKPKAAAGTFAEARLLYEADLENDHTLAAESKRHAITALLHCFARGPAWAGRRLVVLSLKTPDHEQHFGKMAELILKNESAGILNWLLEGRSKLAKDKLQLTQTPEQKEGAATLLLASQSPSAFVRLCLEKRKGSEISAVDLYAHYQEWCRENHVRPFASQAFHQIAREEIEINLGLKYRHDLAGEQGACRGWKGLGLIQRAETGKVENKSAKSEILPR
jgi:hypothetical protein